jgi:TRAP-type C4-dicarboxylate transport system substrate-binding protein
MRAGFFLIASRQFMDGLEPAQQEAIRAAALEAQVLMAEKNAQGAAELFDKLRAEGMEIDENPDLSGFIAASEGVHETYMDQFGRDAYEAARAMGQ